MSGRRHAIAVLLAACLLVQAGRLGAADGPPREALTLEVVQHLAPPADVWGRPVSVESGDADLTVVYVWATWCAKCLQTLQVLDHLQRTHRDALRIVGLNLDLTGRRELLAWLARHDVRWPQWYDTRGANGALAQRLGTSYVPRLFVFDRTGRLIATDVDLPFLDKLTLAAQ